MTRLFREGRTETVRSCTIETCEFVRSMMRDETVRGQSWRRDVSMKQGVWARRKHVSSLPPPPPLEGAAVEAAEDRSRKAPADVSSGYDWQRHWSPSLLPLCGVQIPRGWVSLPQGGEKTLGIMSCLFTQPPSVFVLLEFLSRAA